MCMYSSTCVLEERGSYEHDNILQFLKYVKHLSSLIKEGIYPTPKNFIYI